jgi:hypothetical protein
MSVKKEIACKVESGKQQEEGKGEPWAWYRRKLTFSHCEHYVISSLPLSLSFWSQHMDYLAILAPKLNVVI